VGRRPATLVLHRAALSGRGPCPGEGRRDLPEFAGLARLEDPSWTAITLPKDHSLIADLRVAGVLPQSETGPVELPRGPLVEGVTEGITAIGENIDRAAELGDANSLHLQAMMAADEDTMLTTTSNVLKKHSDTTAALTDTLNG